MILITGATGNFGPATIEFLLKKIPSNQIAALVRDENKAATLKSMGVEVRKGSYDDPESLQKAMKGIEKVLLVSGTDLENRQQQHENIIDAAKEAKVKLLIYTSFMRMNESEESSLGVLGLSHVNTDKYLKASGVPYTIMRNCLYADVLPMFFGEQVLQSGIYLPAGEGKAGYAARREMAEVAANILSGEGHENKEYIIANTESYSMQDAARILSEITGLEITYTSPSKEEFTGALKQAGVPEDATGALAGFAVAIAQNEFMAEETDMEHLLGRKPQGLKEFLKKTYTPHPG